MCIIENLTALILSILMTFGLYAPATHEIAGVPEKSDEAVRIVSFNLRCANDIYGSVKGRGELISAAIEQYEPDSFGVQEATSKWLDILDENLGDKYAFVAQMRDSKASSESSAVFYKKDKYNLIDSGTMWLSDTPDEFSSKFTLSFCPRVATWVVLENKETKEIYTHINTHLDHILESVRVKQVQVLQGKISEFIALGYNVVCTGDFNTKQGADAYNKMSEMLIDSKFIAAQSDDGATYINYGRNAIETKPIDFVFVSDKVKVNTYKIIDEKIDRMYLSDHAGLCVDIEF